MFIIVTNIYKFLVDFDSSGKCTKKEQKKSAWITPTIIISTFFSIFI